MRIHKRGLVGGLVIAVVLSLAGCAVSDESRPRTQSASSAVTNADHLQPTEPESNDPYNAYLSDDLLAINSAKLELEYKCYAANGYPQFLEVLAAQKSNAFRGDALTPDFKSTFASFGETPWFPNEDNARAAGFGHTMPAREPHVFASDGAFAHTSSFCAEKALTAMSGSAELLRAYTTLGNTLADEVGTAARKNEAPLNQKVFDCMNKGDYPVDPNGPNKQDIWNVDFGVPYGSAPPEHWPDLTKGGAIQIVPAAPELRYTPTPQESEAAAAMYQCSIKSGARDLWKKAINEAKQKALADNEVRLSDLNPKIRELAKSAAIAVHSQP